MTRSLRSWLQCVSRLRSFHCHQVRSKGERHLPFVARFAGNIALVSIRHRHPFVARFAGNIALVSIRHRTLAVMPLVAYPTPSTVHRALRSEEHTSELQSRLHLVCRLLLEKKKMT